MACATEGTYLVWRVGAGLAEIADLAAAVVRVQVQHGLAVCRAPLGGETGPTQSPPPALLVQSHDSSIPRHSLSAKAASAPLAR